MGIDILGIDILGMDILALPPSNCMASTYCQSYNAKIDDAWGSLFGVKLRKDDLKEEPTAYCSYSS